MADQNDDRVQSFIDRQGVEQDKQFMIDAILQIKKVIIDVNDVKERLFGSQTLSQAINAIGSLDNQVKKLYQTELLVTKLSIENEKLRLASAKATLEEAKTIEKLSSAKLKDAQATLAQKKADAGEGTGTRTQSAFNELRAQAKAAKLEYLDLLATQKKNGQVTQQELDAAIAKWKSYELQMKQVAQNADVLSSITDREVAAGKTIGGFYEKLLLELKALQAEGQELAAKGLVSGLNETETKRLAEIEVRAGNLSAAFAKIDNQLGKNAKSQFSYTQQLFSLQQVLRETPNIAFGWNIFLASLSNNIPILADDLKRLAERNKELQAAGKPTISVFQQVLKALGSFTSLIAVAVALLTIFGDRIGKFVVSLFRSAEANRKTFLASKEYTEQQQRLLKIQTDLIEIFDKLNKRMAEFNNFGIARIKEQISALESLGLSADKIFGKQKKVIELQQQQFQPRLDQGTQKAQEAIIKNLDLQVDKSSILYDEIKLIQNALNQLAKAPDIIKKPKDFEITAQSAIQAREKQLKQIEQTLFVENKFVEAMKAGQLSVDQILEHATRVKKDQSTVLERERETQDLAVLKTAEELEKKLQTIPKKQQEIQERKLANIKTESQNAEAEAKFFEELENEKISIAGEAEALRSKQTAFFSEQRRRKILSNAKREIDIETSKNDFILENERSNFEQRRQAILSNSNLQVESAKKQKDFVLTALSLSPAEAAEAINNYAVVLQGISKETDLAIERLEQEILERRLSANQSILESSRAVSTKINTEVSQGIIFDLKQRMDSANKLFSDEIDKLQRKFFDEALIAGFTEQEADEFLKTGKFEVANKKKTFEELLAMRSQFEADQQNIITGFTDKRIEIIANEPKRLNEILQDSFDQLEVLSSDQIGQLKHTAQEELNLLNDFAKQSGSAIDKLNRINFQSIKVADEQILQEQLRVAQKELDLFEKTNGDKIKLQKNFNETVKQLDEARALVAKAITPDEKQAASDNFKQAQEAYKQAFELYRKMLELLGKIEELNQQTTEKSKDKILAEQEKQQHVLELWLDFFITTSQQAQNIVQSIHDKFMSNLDEELNALDKRADKEKSIIEQTVTNEDEKQKRIADLELRTQNQREVLEAKRRVIERNAAAAQKSLAIVGIIIEQIKTINTLVAAAAVARATLPPVIANIKAASILAQIPFVIAQGALSIAAIAAQPLPKLKGGTRDFHGTAAVLGDGGKKELVIEPSGAVYKTADTPQVYHLPEHSIVLPDAEKAIEAAMLMTKQRMDGIIDLSTSPDMLSFDNLDNTMKTGFHAIVGAIKNKREIILHRGMNKDLLLRYGYDYYKYIN